MVQGKWFEEFTEGESMVSRGRTVTEADIVTFAGLSGDFNPMHTDAEYAKGTQFGARVAQPTQCPHVPIANLDGVERAR